MSSPKLIATLDDALSHLPQEIANNNDVNASIMVQFRADDWRKIKADLAEAKTEAGDDATLTAELAEVTTQRDEARAQVSDLTVKLAEMQAKVTIAKSRITQLEAENDGLRKAPKVEAQPAPVAGDGNVS